MYVSIMYISMYLYVCIYMSYRKYIRITVVALGIIEKIYVCVYLRVFLSSLSHALNVDLRGSWYGTIVLSEWSFGGRHYGTIVFSKWSAKDPSMNNGGEKET